MDRDYCWIHRHDEEIVVSSGPNWLKEVSVSNNKYHVKPDGDQE
jgi:hypothetical protein